MYIKNMPVDDAHIDFQDVVDGLYYPFYMEEVRHSYVKDVLNFDLVEQSKNGVNFVLSQYALKFKAPLLRGDVIDVTCSGHLASDGKPFVYFKQTIIRSERVVTEAIFKATCTSATARVPFIPDSILDILAEEEKLVYNWL